jgi:hypothetical protein
MFIKYSGLHVEKNVVEMILPMCMIDASFLEMKMA